MSTDSCFFKNNENDIREWTKKLPPSHRLSELEILQKVYLYAKKEGNVVTMTNVKQREELSKEQSKLVKKMAKLQSFTVNNPITSLMSREHHELLKIQRQIMDSYLSVLVARERLLYTEAKNNANQ